MRFIALLLLSLTCALAACGGGSGDGATPPSGTGSYTLRRMAIGETREIAQEDMRVELKDVADSRCPSAVVCITAGFATADLLVRIGTRAPEPLTVKLDPGANDQPAVFAGYRFTLDKLDPYPVTGPSAKDQYRADITVQKL